MNIKKIVASSISVLVISWGFLACQGQPNKSEKAVEVITDFYTQYLSESCGLPSDESKVNSILKKYCTERMLMQLQVQGDEMDYDLLINGQYCEKEWLRAMSVAKDGANRYTVTFKYIDISENKEKKKDIRLEVVEKSGNILLDKVLLQ